MDPTTSPVAPGARPAAFFTPRDLAVYLGVSVRTVRTMIAEHRIPSYLFEGSRRIAADDVHAYVRARREA